MAATKGKTLVQVDEDTVDQYFKGIMLECHEPFIGTVRRPGWECRACGWRIGGEGLPPAHWCPRGMTND